MVRCFSCALDFGQSNNTFYGISAFFKHNFCLVLRWKINQRRWIYFFLDSLESLNLVLIPGAKLDGHRGTWTGCFLFGNLLDMDDTLNYFICHYSSCSNNLLRKSIKTNWFFSVVEYLWNLEQTATKVFWHQ